MTVKLQSIANHMRDLHKVYGRPGYEVNQQGYNADPQGYNVVQQVYNVFVLFQVFPNIPCSISGLRWISRVKMRISMVIRGCPLITLAFSDPTLVSQC